MITSEMIDIRRTLPEVFFEMYEPNVFGSLMTHHHGKLFLSRYLDACAAFIKSDSDLIIINAVFEKIRNSLPSGADEYNKALNIFQNVRKLGDKGPRIIERIGGVTIKAINDSLAIIMKSAPSDKNTYYDRIIAQERELPSHSFDNFELRMACNRLGLYPAYESQCDDTFISQIRVLLASYLGVAPAYLKKLLSNYEPKNNADNIRATLHYLYNNKTTARAFFHEHRNTIVYSILIEDQSIFDLIKKLKK